MSRVKLSREDRKKAMELEELRKTGAAPPELDEDGKMINPHIPQYVSEAPWYLNINRPGLKHQYSGMFGGGTVYSTLEQHRNVKLAPSTKKTVRKKFKPGSCTNCGAMTHKKKDCLERPRKKTAKLLNKQLAPDEVVKPELTLEYDAKRDMYAGYDTRQYQRVIENYAREDEARKKLRAEQLEVPSLLLTLIITLITNPNNNPDNPNNNSDNPDKLYNSRRT